MWWSWFIVVLDIIWYRGLFIWLHRIMKWERLLFHPTYIANPGCTIYSAPYYSAPFLFCALSDSAQWIQQYLMTHHSDCITPSLDDESSCCSWIQSGSLAHTSDWHHCIHLARFPILFLYLTYMGYIAYNICLYTIYISYLMASKKVLIILSH